MYRVLLYDPHPPNGWARGSLKSNILGKTLHGICYTLVGIYLGKTYVDVYTWATPEPPILRAFKLADR